MATFSHFTWFISIFTLIWRHTTKFKCGWLIVINHHVRESTIETPCIIFLINPINIRMKVFICKSFRILTSKGQFGLLFAWSHGRGCSSGSRSGSRTVSTMFTAMSTVVFAAMSTMVFAAMSATILDGQVVSINRNNRSFAASLWIMFACFTDRKLL